MWTIYHKNHEMNYRGIYRSIAVCLSNILIVFCLQRYLDEIQVLNETDIKEKLNPKWRKIAKETLDEPKSDVDKKARKLYKTYDLKCYLHIRPNALLMMRHDVINLCWCGFYARKVLPQHVYIQENSKSVMMIKRSLWLVIWWKGIDNWNNRSFALRYYMTVVVICKPINRVV